MGSVQHMALDRAVGVDNQDDDAVPFCALQGQPLGVVGCCNCNDDDTPHSGVPGGSHATTEDPAECQSRQLLLAAEKRFAFEQGNNSNRCRSSPTEGIEMTHQRIHVHAK